MTETEFRMPSAALWAFLAERLFIFANRENLRIFPIGLFMGGPVAENDIYNNYYRLSKMQK